MNKIANKGQLFFALGLFFVLLVWNFLFLPQSDDFTQHLSALDPNRNFLTSYLTWNGRFGEILSTGLLARFFFGPFAWIFDFLNAWMGVIYFYAFFLLCFGRLPSSKEDFFSFAFLIGFICAFGHFGAVFLWGAGALNYLWGVGLILCFLVPFRLFYEEKFREKSEMPFFQSLPFQWIFSLFIFVLGFLAGMSSEFIGLAVIVVLMLLFFRAWIKNWKQPFWQYFGIFGVSLGWIALFLSPGSRVRAELVAQKGNFISLSDFLDWSFLEMLLWINQTFNFSATSLIFRVFLLVFMIFIFEKIHYFEKMKAYTLVKKSVSIFFILLLYVGVILFSKYICALLVYGIILFCLIKLAKTNPKYYIFLGLFVVRLFMDLSLFQLQGNIAARAEVGKDLVLVGILMFIFKEWFFKNPRVIGRIIIGQLGVGILFVSIGCYDIWVKSNALKDQILGKGPKDEVVLSKEVMAHKFLGRYFLDYSHLSKDPKHWLNRSVAEYYGVKSVRVE